MTSGGRGRWGLTAVSRVLTFGFVGAGHWACSWGCSRDQSKGPGPLLCGGDRQETNLNACVCVWGRRKQKGALRLWPPGHRETDRQHCAGGSATCPQCAVWGVEEEGEGCSR